MVMEKSEELTFLLLSATQSLQLTLSIYPFTKIKLSKTLNLILPPLLLLIVMKSHEDKQEFLVSVYLNLEQLLDNWLMFSE